VQFEKPQPFTHLIDRIARGMGSPAGFPVAIPQDRSVEDITIRTIAICAGSGGSVFRGVVADLLFTGELNHHEALSAIERGMCVVTLFHSNTERGFLRAVMQPKLERMLKNEWARVRREEKGHLVKSKGSEQCAWEETLEDESIEIECSDRDRDPYGIVILQDSQVPGTMLESGEVQVQGDGKKQ
jgi:NIF3 (NGG1p interacting factor 3)